DPEQIQPKEATVVQMQRDYEKLSFISGSLQKDSEKKQKEIEMLFQSLEKLQKEKANHLDILAAMDVKADKAALGSKVNCSQFEANMERLDERMQELQSQISGQEQHWNNMQQQLSLVEEEKLDRLELKTFRYQMEETWKRRIEELRNEMKEGDSGAGIKKQLPVPFTCLSCDRMLSVQVPGQ
ncbi:QRIC2 protein, partial [Loxia leucoptera]|nr:QRIC2 protein [Loxia leucoptera]